MGPRRDTTSPAGRIGRLLSALVLAVMGAAVGGLVITHVLDLPVGKGVLLALSGLIAAAALGSAVALRQWWLRALLVGIFIGTAASLALVVLVVG